MSRQDVVKEEKRCALCGRKSIPVAKKCRHCGGRFQKVRIPILVHGENYSST